MRSDDEATGRPLNQVLSHLRGMEAPVQIFFNRTTAPSMTTRRFGDLRTTWLVLVRATRHGEPLWIDIVGSRCMYWSSSKVILLSVIYQHLINLIMISFGGQAASQFTVKPIMPRFWTPSYIMILEWHLPLDVVPPDKIWAYDVCFKEPFYSCRELRMPNYFMLGKNGIDAVVQQVNLATRDFYGDRIFINPFQPSIDRWETWKRILSTPLWQHQGAKSRLDAKLGIILGLFAERNNLTFDTATQILG